MFANSDPVSRRTLLRGLGVSMALPWLESLPQAAAAAGSAADQPPTRTLVTFTGMGFQRFYRLKRVEEQRSAPVELVGDRPEFFNLLLQAAWPNVSNMLALEVKHPGVVDRLLTELDRWRNLKSEPSNSPPLLDAADLEILRNLGYEPSDLDEAPIARPLQSELSEHSN